jgi:hypothetical protein
MSAGGQRGTDVSGITGLRLQNASDATTRLRLQEIFQNFASTTGANAYRNRTPNGYGYFLDFTQGRKEVGRRDISGSDCSTCTGLPYQMNLVMNFRPA